ncbi:hypothetical protein [Streptomyces hilarionis]|uniref:hypothetical protein n=1 Tax=Streptomyces hilarionis TaxID=2839954 RepID=UPI002119BAF3|nr:hypothetical protein [Streptomyces hilarionis]MCQ9133256.1 hypothetical protein [Streptomyces hilarionis]
MTDQPYDASYQGERPHRGYEGYEGYQGHEGYQGPDGYEGHQGHDPRAPQPQDPQAWPGQQQGYDDPQAQPHHTQQWQGQTWETSVQQPVTAADPARTDDGPGYGTPQPAYGDRQTSYGDQQPAYGDHQPAHGDRQTPYGHQQAAFGGQPSVHGDPQSPYGGSPAYGVAATGHGHAPSAYGAPSGAGPLPPEHRSAGGDRQAAPVPAPAPRHGAPASPAPAPAAAAGPDTGSPTTGPTYGPATLAGNARITDAQRARLEGRSPIIEPGMQPAALTALLGLLLSGAAAIGTYALLVPLVALQAVTAAGWFRLNGMWPARQGIALAFLGALVSDVVLLAAGREHAPAAILGTLGVWVLLCLVLQLRSHADPDERMYGLMATVASSALAVLATGHLGAEPDAVTVGAAAVAVAVLARALPLPTPASVVVALLAAAGAGIAVGQMTGMGARGALLGAGAAVCALIGHRVASYDYPSRFVHFTAGVALPLAAAAPAVYVLGRALA